MYDDCSDSRHDDPMSLSELYHCGPDGRRTGFQAIDLVSSEEATLASTNGPPDGRPRVGRYRVDLDAFDGLLGTYQLVLLR